MPERAEFNISGAQYIKELFASVVVFLVALPLCLGVAIASGVPAIYGLITGVVGGLVTGFFAGCPLQISGPAGGLIVIAYEIIAEFGIESLGLVVFLAGILQILVGQTGLATWFKIVSPAIIRGMLSGIGVIIFASQFHVMLGSTPAGSTLENLLTIPNLLLMTIIPKDETTYHIAAGVGLVTLLSIICWNALSEKLAKVVPASLIAVIVTVVVTNVLSLPIDYVNIPDNILSELKPIDFSGASKVLSSFDGLVTIITLAFIGSVQALLTTQVIDKERIESKTKLDKELTAQGVGNAIAGLLGVLPLTGVIVRSVVCINAGGMTRLVSIFQGVLIALTLLFFSDFVEYIPLAALAAILVYVSVKLINVKQFIEVTKYGKSELLICLVTFLLVIITNIFEGVLIGILLSSIKLLYNLSKFKSRLIRKGKRYHLKLIGSVNFVNLPSLSKMLDGIPDLEEVVVDTSKLSYIDHTCFDYIDVWQKRYEALGGKVELERSYLESRVVADEPQEKIK